jgi:low affinity Fe/Cu permease
LFELDIPSSQDEFADGTNHRRKGDRMADWFSRFARYAARLSGHYLAFTIALAIIVVWAATGPIFKFSSTWQLIINTGTTTITFLMVFLLQNSQNRDSEAIHIKLDEIVNSIQEADDLVINAEEDTQEQLDQLKKKYAALQKAHENLKTGQSPQHNGEPNLADRAGGGG